MAEHGHRLAAVVPALDEVEAIPDVVAGLRAAGACCVFVVDGGSRDGTPDAARAAGAVVLAQEARGYGAACATGLRAATGHELIAVLDGDGSCDPAELAALVAAAPGADLVLGRRVRVAPGALPWHARLGNRLVAVLLHLRTGRRVGDLPPFKLLPDRALPALALDEPGYGWTVELVGRALASPWLRVAEAPVSFRPRAGGRSKVSGQPLASARAAVAMLRGAATATRRRGLLAVMAKAPRSGHAKTRLAAEIGEPAAIAFWRACLRDVGARTLAAARAAGLDAVAMTPPGDADDVRALTGLPCVGQRSPGLAGALSDAFRYAAAHRLPFAIVLGADVPTVPTEVVAEAAAALRGGQPVLGPGDDGGYYLLGLPLPAGLSRLDRLFGQFTLGDGDVLARTRRALPGAREVRSWPDVDGIDELRRLAAELAMRPELAPAIAAWLRGSGREREPQAGGAVRGLGAHAPAGLLDELLHDRQSDARPARRPVP